MVNIYLLIELLAAANADATLSAIQKLELDNCKFSSIVIAPGDRIPLHTHPISEVIVIQAGSPEVTLGDDTQLVGPGTVVFIPAGTPHGTRNASTSPVRIHAMFPSERIGIQYLERNPAPGTESDAPQPAFTIDARALAQA